ncbi:hypothetical protein FA13DRAFT_1711641 [Coprinellus micaceus]|uniref:Uncharacterized protein n=1 Tax=Coprinellus micaceus TaxID=71717 RepID=A0A4Y7T365_COPMI|nr:hypothetical protein FA13DRAFT_1711641 [Coprinellus micaceus]
MAPRKSSTNVPQSLPETDGADHPAESTATERESCQRAVTNATSSTAVDDPTAPRTRKAAQVEGVNPGPTPQPKPKTRAASKKTAGTRRLDPEPMDVTPPINVAQPKRKRRTKAQIEADKRAELEEKSRVEELETTLKDKLEKKILAVKERDRDEIAQRQTELIRHRPPVEPSMPPVHEDDIFSCGPGQPHQEAAISGGGQLEEDFEQELLDVELEDESESESDNEEIRRIQEELKEAKLKKQMEKAKKKGVERAPKAPNDNSRKIASGLREEYRTTKASVVPAVSVNPIGGIGDEDLEDARPHDDEPRQVDSAPGAHTQFRGRNMNRKNTLVSLLPPTAVTVTKNTLTLPLRMTTVTPTTTPVVKTPSNLTPAPHTLQHRSSTSSLGSSSQRANKSTNRAGKPSAPTPSPTPQPDGARRAKTLTASSVRKRDLPAFTQTQRRWNVHFLPTIYASFYHSAEPFKDFIVSTPRFVGIIQGAVDTVYPDFEHEVQLYGDAILLMAYNRINDRRGNLAELALELVSLHVRGISNLSEANEWLAWARRLTGPLYFVDATPYYCKAKIGEPGFIPPSGKMKTKFVTAMVKQALDLSKSAIVNRKSFQPPLGLFGIVLAALGRAATIVQADGSIPEGLKDEFSYELYGEKVADAISSIQGISEEKWLEILACSTTVHLDKDHDGDGASDESIGHIDRRQMFTFESPVKRQGFS